MFDEAVGRPFALFLLAGVYLFSLLMAFSAYGSPFPFLGSCYFGRAGECLVFADGMLSLYLVIGILKRQRLALWLLLAYNLLDVCNAWANLALLSAQQYAGAAGSSMTEGELWTDTVAAAVVLLFLSLYAFANRRHFDNRSLLLF